MLGVMLGSMGNEKLTDTVTYALPGDSWRALRTGSVVDVVSMRQERSIDRAIMNHTYIEEFYIYSKSFQEPPHELRKIIQDSGPSAPYIHTACVAPEQTGKHKRPFISLPPPSTKVSRSGYVTENLTNAAPFLFADPR